MKISVQYGYTKNLGNYESERLQCEISRDIDQGETPERAWEMEFQKAKKFIQTALGIIPSDEANVEAQRMLSRRGRR